MILHVTGGRGFIGKYIQDRFLRNDAWQIESSDRNDLDVTNAPAVRAWFTSRRPDAVVHLAALCGAAASRENPPEFFRVNALGTVNVLEACRRARVGKFVLASSLTVLGSGNEAKTEDSTFAPRHPYAMSKIAAEEATRHYCREFGLKAVILRPALVVGPGCKELHAAGDFAARAFRREPIVLQGDGGHRRDFVHPADVGQAVENALKHLDSRPAGSCEVFNVSTGEAVSMRELALLATKAAGGGSFGHQPSTNQTFSLFTRIDRARKMLGFEPQFHLEQIVSELIANLKERSADVRTQIDDHCHDDQYADAFA